MNDEITDEQLRVKIAESVGWTRMEVGLNPGAHGKTFWTAGSSLQGTPPRDKDKHEDDQAYEKVPDYLNDLNAMHEAEKTLTGKECEQYQAELDALGSEERFLRVELDHPAEEYFFHATARQRATAFLRAVGKGGA